MAYSELIKNFGRIRAYMRSFYVYGFHRRDEYNQKSARGYDDERRRVESWLGDYMTFRQDGTGRRFFLSVDSRAVPHNPLYRAFRAKSFTDRDIMLHFHLMDILAVSGYTPIFDIMEQLAERLNTFTLAEYPDESTVRRKLSELEKLGLVRKEKRGRETRYCRTVENVNLESWREAIDFFSEAVPLGMIGDFCRDKLEEKPSLFRFKHHYIPALLKRAWAKRIGDMDAYTMAKYRNAGIGLVDAVRICHAKGPLVDTLMRQGRVPMPEGQDTWERLRASGKGWKEILSEIRMPHMALLRNLRGIFSEVRDADVRRETLEQLERGVKKGRQFPFRYLSAWRAVDETGQAWTNQVKRSLESCIDRACENLPALPGRCAFLTDNSGSAWGTCTSEWGTMQVAEIGNLSAVIEAMRADEGVAFPFGDRLVPVPIHKDEGVLAQQRRVSASGRTCGGGTENGVWLFFRDAIHQRQHWDSIFIYSDMQAGHGGLYGTNPEDYAAIGCKVRGTYIDVNRLVQLYRQQVNPKVNVYCIQTAGYTNVLVPEYGYRTAVLYGWTGRELVFADAMRRIWDDMEARKGQ